MEERTLVVGVIGLGTVGSGVVTLLREHAVEIAARVGAPVAVGPVAVGDPGKARAVEVAVTGDAWEVVADPEVDIVVEVMGGVDAAYDLVRAALEQGKHVVTANKALLATRGGELVALAQGKGLRLEYEAAVAGAIPIVKPLRESLAGDRVRKVLGILNGTTNYILTKMAEEGRDFAEVLAEAQALGYAEADPTADIGGSDAAAKAAILASLAFDATVTLDQVFTEGIAHVSAADLAHAARMGYVVKLLAIAEDYGPEIGVRVHPALLPRDHPLASVRDTFNAIFVEADAAGELMFYGRGAGSLPTASAVVGDIVTVARALLAGGELPRVDVASRPWRAMEDVAVQYYMLLDVEDAPGVLAQVAATFGDHDVSIKSVWQEGEGDLAQLLLITHAAREGNVRACVDTLRAMDVVRDIASLIRVEGGEA